MIVQLVSLPVDVDYRAPLGAGVFDLWQEADQAAWIDVNRDAVQVLITHAMHQVSGELIRAFPRLGLIANFGVGLENIDLDTARQRGVAVTYTPDALTDDVADLAMLLALASLRRLPDADAFVKGGRWSGERFAIGRSAKGCKLGLFGFGRIGKAVAHRAEAHGMEVAYVARSDHGGQYMRHRDLVSLAAWADILILVASGGAETANAVDANVLTALGPGGYLVNVARGSLVDERALHNALASGTIAGAALDVFATEPEVSPDLMSAPNLIATPHIGSATRETRRAMADQVYANAFAFLAGAPLRDRIV